MILLIRQSPGYWVKWGHFPTRRAAWKAWQKHIQGQGITAWTEIVTDKEAKRMLAGTEAP